MIVPTIPPLDLNNVQGDILLSLPKKAESFLCFRILPSQTAVFRSQLAHLIPHLTTASQCRLARTQTQAEKVRAAHAHQPPKVIPLSFTNIAFSHSGLKALSIADDLGDSAFDGGMLADAEGLGDDLNQWDVKFKEVIHGVLLVSGSSETEVRKTLAGVLSIFAVGKADASIEAVVQLDGKVRPGKEEGNEHFGFLDGISQPAVDGINQVVHRGQDIIHQGVILVGRAGDNGTAIPGKPVVPVKRPSWALDGSFLAFRYLKQLVPEFDTFLAKNALAPGGQDGADLLGARLVGRWKSGAPVDLSPLADNPNLGTNASQNDDFRYDINSQSRCPFAAHTRKMNPRADLDAFGGTEVRRILRRGIQFGPEVTAAEREHGASSTDPALERGLLFVSYQSNVLNGFQFLQKSWANDAAFPPAKNAAPVSPVIPTPPGPGFDGLIGVNTTGGDRSLVGTNPAVQTTELDLTAKWVIPKGGEYFFSPSISALASKFAAHAPPALKPVRAEL